MSDEDRIARVARALCVADGVDPEERVYVGSASTEAEGGESYYEALAPAWTSYAEEARRMIAAVTAMGLLE